MINKILAVSFVAAALTGSVATFAQTDPHVGAALGEDASKHPGTTPEQRNSSHVKDATRPTIKHHRHHRHHRHHKHHAKLMKDDAAGKP